MMEKARRKIGRDVIYNEILDKIQYCEWTPGMPISETSLAELFQVSRTPVREALFLLARDGFVDIYPQSGSFVSKIDIKRIREILFLRYHLETPALLVLAQQRAEIPENVEKLVLLADFAASKENWAECVQIDYEIHQELMAMAGHSILWDLIRKELPHYTRFRFFEPNHAEFKGDSPRSLQEHKDIIACIQAGDVQGLQEVLGSHYDHTFSQRKEYNLERIQRHPDYFVNLEEL